MLCIVVFPYIWVAWCLRLNCRYTGLNNIGTESGCFRKQSFPKTPAYCCCLLLRLQGLLLAPPVCHPFATRGGAAPLGLGCRVPAQTSYLRRVQRSVR